MLILKSTTTCLDFQQTQVEEKIIHHETLGKLWEVLGADMFTLNNKKYLCVVDYYSKFSVFKKTEELSADSLILSCNFIFPEYGFPKKTMSDTGGNSVSDKSKQFCKMLSTEKQHHHHTITRSMDSLKCASNS